MLISQINLLTYLVIGSVVVFVNALNKSSKVTQDAWIWPGVKKVGIHLTFSDTVNWSDLWWLRGRKGFFTVGKLCVRGSFILYDEPQYGVIRPDGFEIVSGNIKCSKLPESTKSIQLVGSVGNMNGPSITFFEKSSFASQAFPTVVNVGSTFFQKMPATRSAIIVGSVPWTLKFDSGERICVQPDFDPTESRPICLVKDFSLLMEMENTTTVLLKATQGCKKNINPESVYKIQDCRYWGRPANFKGGKLLSSRKNLAGRTDDLNATKPDFCTDEPDKAKRIFQLYRAIVSSSLQSNLIIDWTEIEKHNVWKLELLDLIFEIAQSVIPHAEVPSIFMEHVRELFIDRLSTQLNKDDNKQNQSRIPLSDREYINLILLTESCLKVVQADPKAIGALAIPWSTINSINDFNNYIDEAFKRDKERDVVTEVVWIIGHLAGYLCHTRYMLESHYWTLFFKAFLEIYIEPVAPQWKTETVGLNFIFGGVDYLLSYNKIAVLATQARGLASGLEPLKRPRM